MLTQALAIARNTFVESLRQPIYFILILAGLLLQSFNLLLSAYSMGYSDSSEVSKDDKLLLDMGLATVFVLATILAALTSTAVLSREIDRKTALTVISKPVGRPVFVIGKYLGTAGAVVLATYLQILFLLLAIRHGVMMRATDTFDPVVIGAIGASMALAIGVAAWGNYFYGWVFSSTAVYILTPALTAGLVLALALDRNAAGQIIPITESFKPQVTLAASALLLAAPVLAAIALAASTRLGQVMTITLCAGVFLLGLLSNYFFGRHAYQNQPIATITEAEPVTDRDGDFRDPGDTWRLTLDGPTAILLSPGDRLYYGPTPDGLALIPPTQASFEGDLDDPATWARPRPSPNVIVRQVEPVEEDIHRLRILNAGGVRAERPPAAGQFLFATETRVNWPARAAWSVVPNLQFFWLVDAVTQAHSIPARYVGLVALYSAVQVAGLVALAVILFQKREVG
ncbi:MAG: ABC transporter permease [Planctomycetota bacterium]|nr:MAG: ABC transporter permease [Planctomycetota bacterium]